eukprot:Phypoly_transcript_02008.p1 GENE.Phypoly_transcript_02008~~Phypoly_transcript_02008.p1  ORF type:complete len:931 (+),score=141.26 Phypoly_transcript_02008:32-2824(+)
MFALNKIVGYVRGWNEDRHMEVTKELVDELSYQLKYVWFQDYAVSALRSWVRALSKDRKGAMLGNLCFAGQEGTGQTRCIKSIGRAFWGPGAKIEDIDMRPFTHPNHIIDFISELQRVHGANVITFSHISRAHPSILKVIDEITRTRKFQPEYYRGMADTLNSLITSQLQGELSFVHVVFIALHYLPLHEENTITSAHQVLQQTKHTLAAKNYDSRAFDTFVPFMELSDEAMISIIGRELDKIGVENTEERADEVMQSVCGNGGFRSSVHSYLQTTGEVIPAPSSIATKTNSKRSKPSNGYPLLATQAKKPKTQEIHSHNTTITTSNSNNSTTASHNPHTSSSHNPTTGSHNLSKSQTHPTATKGANRDATKSFNRTNSHIPVTPQMTISNSKNRDEESLREEDEGIETYQPFPIRNNINVKPFVDGQDYFRDLNDAIKKAQHELLICGWQLGDIHLLRPITDPAHSSLIALLGDAAKRGVTIYIMLREDDSKMLINDHHLYKSTLELLYPNKVKVSLQRRGGKMVVLGRDITGPYPSVWSHHQKFVVIDGKLAYIGGLDLTYSRWDTPEHKIVERESMIPDKDYYHSGFTVKTDRRVHPRMGWHDVQVSVDGLIATDLRTSFCQRWNSAKENANHKLPYTLQVSTPGPRSLIATSPAVQVVRSISELRANKIEASIKQSYCALIADAPSFVYIENQYFVAKKTFSETIITRIKKAKLDNKLFSIMVVLPLSPDNGTQGNDIMAQQYASIANIKTNLQADGIDANDYIKFYGLFNHGELNGQRVGAQIYVHSKVMISDKIAMVGSANINARSMEGDRDSEIAVVVQDPSLCSRLTQQLLSEHTGRQVTKEIVSFMKEDVVQVATKNTEIYNSMFGPLLKVCNTSDSDDVTAKNVDVSLSEISGHIVTFHVPEMLKRDSLKKLNPLRYITG